MAGFKDFCLLSVDVGSCQGYFPKWFYNLTSARCEQFIYGGCQGNLNIFDSRESCETACICGEFIHTECGCTISKLTCQCSQQIGVHFSQRLDPVGQELLVTSTIQHLATVNNSLMVVVEAITTDFRQLLNVLHTVQITVSEANLTSVY